MFLAWTFVGWAWVSFGWVNDCQPLINELLAPFVVNQCGVANWPTATVNRGDDLDFHVCKMPTSKWVGVNPVKFEMGISYLRIMKTILSLLFAVTLGTAFGQFIPQPMGYNPDVNGDEFIGVDDVMGTLALYDNAFDNGDSIVSVFETVTVPNDTIVVDDSVDILYITTQMEDNDELVVVLPQGGAGFKSLLIFLNNQGSGSLWVRMWQQNSLCQPSGYCERAYLGVNPPDPECFILIRGEDGTWYRPI